MHTIIILLFLFVLFNGEQLKKDKLYRASVFALIGASYFFILQYSIYWYRVFPTQSVLQYIPGLVAVLATVAIALSKWNKRSHPVKTIIICSLFVVSLIASFGFDKQIKEKLAELGGYFDTHNLSKTTTESTNNSYAYKFADIGLSMQLSKDWQVKTLGSGHQYIVMRDEQELLLEVRPNCLSEVKVDTPTLIENTIELLEARSADNRVSHSCSNYQQGKVCLVKVVYEFGRGNIKERWRWLQLDNPSARPYLIDVLFFDKNPELRSEAWMIITSSTPVESSRSRYCSTPSAWL